MKKALIGLSVLVTLGVVASTAFVLAENSNQASGQSDNGQVSVSSANAGGQSDSKDNKEGNTPSSVQQFLAAGGVKPFIGDLGESDLRQELDIKALRAPLPCESTGNLRCLPADLANSTEVLMHAAKVTAVASGTLTVSLFTYSYTIDASNAQNIVKRAWGQSDLQDFSAGDIVNVFGYLDQNNNYLVHAQTVRNLSISKQGSWRGAISSINSDSKTFVLDAGMGKSSDKGNQATAQARQFTVVVGSDTQILIGAGAGCNGGDGNKCVSAPVKQGSFGDLQVGMRVVVRGLLQPTPATACTPEGKCNSSASIRAQVILVGTSEDVRPFFQGGTNNPQNDSTPSTSSTGNGKEGEGTDGQRSQLKNLQQTLMDLLKRLNNQ